MTNYTIALIFSGVTAVFTMLSAWTPDKKKSFFFQTAQCLIYAGASWFFGVYPAIISMLVCAIRNYLVAKEKYTRAVAVILTSITAAAGIAANTSGFIGMLPVIATVEYGIFLSMFQSRVSSKANTLANLLLWVGYDFLIRDFINFTVDSVSSVLAVVSIIRITHDANAHQSA